MKHRSALGLVCIMLASAQTISINATIEFDYRPLAIASAAGGIAGILTSKNSDNLAPILKAALFGCIGCLLCKHMLLDHDAYKAWIQSTFGTSITAPDAAAFLSGIAGGLCLWVFRAATKEQEKS